MLVKRDGSIKTNKLSEKGGKDVQIVVFSKEDENGDHRKLRDPIAMDTPKETPTSTTNTNIENKEPENRASTILESGLSVSLVISQVDSPVPGPADVVAVAFAVATLTTAGIVWMVDEISKGNSKNEKHGDGGRAKTKAEQQVQDLEQKLQGATGSEKIKIKQKIKNIKENAQRKSKGEEHSRANKK